MLKHLSTNMCSICAFMSCSLVLFVSVFLHASLSAFWSAICPFVWCSSPIHPSVCCSSSISPSVYLLGWSNWHCLSNTGAYVLRRLERFHCLNAAAPLVWNCLPVHLIASLHVCQFPERRVFQVAQLLKQVMNLNTRQLLFENRDRSPMALRQSPPTDKKRCRVAWLVTTFTTMINSFRFV